MFDLNNIYLGDCLNLMSKIPDGTIDLIICDGPYNSTNHEWDQILNIQEYNLNLIKIFSRILKTGGVAYIFGKSSAFDFIDYRPFLQLNSRILWYQPSRLSQGRKNYTNNYDLIGYFSKNNAKTFNLNDIRVSQMVGVEHRKRCENVPSVLNGKWRKTKFNELGKNPGNVWNDIKQLTYKSKELISRDLLNTIQKPILLMNRLIKASSNINDLILVPFVGVGTECLSARNLNRQFIGFEKEEKYFNIAKKRLIL
ncbi:MAG: DNA methyltransferase [Nanoarchaeota archaeon]